MSTVTPRAALPELAAAQAQKHVTHNEALIQLDALLNARILDRNLAAPPANPANGDAWLVATNPTGVWAGQSGKIAFAVDGGWRFYAPFIGLTVFVADESVTLVYTATGWVDWSSIVNLQNVPLLGVNTAADVTNKFALKANAALFAALEAANGGTGDMRIVNNKSAAANTASFLFQDNFSGRAELGLTGDDNFHLKVSANGASWTEAITVSAATGNVGIGTTNPASKCSVAGDIIVGGTNPASIASSGSLNLRLGLLNGTPNNSTDAFVAVENTGGPGGSAGDLLLIPRSSTGVLNAIRMFTGQTVPQERLTIDTSGNVLVGTTSNGNNARFALAASGSKINTVAAVATTDTHVLFSNPNGNVGSITTNGTGTSYNTTSDVRLKTNIADAQDAGVFVDALRVRSFDWRDGSGHVDYWFVAQELYDAAPFAVTKGDGDKIPWAIDPAKLVPLLVKEIQSLRVRLKTLERKIGP